MFTSDIIRRALEEDLGHGDITSEAVIPRDLQGHGVIVAKQDLVLAGLGVAGGVFVTVNPAIRLRQLKNDGQAVKKGTEVLEVDGSYRDLLAAERTALNFLQHLSGIATLTKKYVDQTGKSKTKILDTRKTTPTFRHLEKYAVRMGGGTNHRIGLFDAILIKDNHVAACKGSVAEAIRRAKNADPTKPVIAEVTSPDQINSAIQADADRLLLDNMSDDQIDESVKLATGRTEIEVSGGITLERVKVLSKMGVDFISVGAITHSAPAVDLSFDIQLK